MHLGPSAVCSDHSHCGQQCNRKARAEVSGTQVFVDLLDVVSVLDVGNVNHAQGDWPEDKGPGAPEDGVPWEDEPLDPNQGAEISVVD